MAARQGIRLRDGVGLGYDCTVDSTLLGGRCLGEKQSGRKRGSNWFLGERETLSERECEEYVRRVLIFRRRSKPEGPSYLQKHVRWVPAGVHVLSSDITRLNAFAVRQSL